MVEERHSAAVEYCWKGEIAVYVLFLHLFPEKRFLGFLLLHWGLLLRIVWGGQNLGVSIHLWNLGFKFHNWGSRELARKNTRLPHYFNSFPELLERGLIIASSLSGDCAGVFLKFRSSVRKQCLEHAPKERRLFQSSLCTYMLFPLIKAA